jgi:hypothetical protein
MGPVEHLTWNIVKSALKVFEALVYQMSSKETNLQIRSYAMEILIFLGPIKERLDNIIEMKERRNEMNKMNES